VITDPLEGARKDGVSGFVYGVGTGVLGIQINSFISLNKLRN
jgi:hypothetical protein